MTPERQPRHLSNEPPGRQWELRKPGKRLSFGGFLRSAIADLYGTSLGRLVLVLTIPLSLWGWGTDVAADAAGALFGMGLGFGLLLLAWAMSGFDERYRDAPASVRKRAFHDNAGKTLIAVGFGVVTIAMGLVNLVLDAIR